MRILLLIFGALAILLGVIWIGQGMGYLTYTPAGMKPSFMIGDMHWTYIGAAVAFVGLLIVYFSRRRA